MKKKVILVTGASGIVGYGTLKNLRKSRFECKLIGSSIYQESPANAFSDVFELAPLTTNDNYFSWLSSIIKKYCVDMIIPCIESDVQTWNRCRNLLPKNTVALLNNSSLIELCADKWLFYQKIKNTPYAIPSLINCNFKKASNIFGKVFLIKPRKGMASRGVSIIENEDQFNKLVTENDKFIIQPVIGNENEEYTVSGFFLENGSLFDFMGLKRKLGKEGFTNIAETCDSEDLSLFHQALENLSKILKPVGPTNFQFRKDDKGNLKLLEINPRISSATSIRAAFGYNEQEMSIEYFLEKSLFHRSNQLKGKAIRYTDDFVVTY